MVNKVFWDYPYQTELETRINTVDDNKVTVDDTIFFAFSGGQESDHGLIDNRAVIKAEKKDKQIYYTLESTAGLMAGDTVLISIDWSRRNRLMRLHFAAEVILELIYQFHPGTSKVGAHIAADKARIDFEWDGNISDQFPALSLQFSQIIENDLPIVCDFSDASNERRYWKIDGFAKIPCGGTHVRSTGEVGPVILKRKNPGKGKERIEIVLDEPTGFDT